MGKKINIKFYQQIKQTAKQMKGKPKKEVAAVTGVSLETLRRVERSRSFKHYTEIVKAAHSKSTNNTTESSIWDLEPTTTEKESKKKGFFQRLFKR